MASRTASRRPSPTKGAPTKGAAPKTGPAKPAPRDAAFDAALALHRAGRLDEAAAAYRAVLVRSPAHARALQYLGVVLRRQGDARAGVTAMGRALALDPDDVGAYGNLARGLIDRRDPGGAAVVLRRGLTRFPDEGALHALLAHALSQARRLDEAIEAGRRATELAPTERESWLNFGTALHQAGRSEEALAAYDRVLELGPERPDIHQNRGTLFKSLGRVEDARAAFRRAIALDPTAADAWRSLMDMRKARPDDPEVKELEALHAKRDLGRSQRMGVCFALGKVYDDLGSYDRAFACFREGNALKRSTLPYRVEHSLESFRRIAEVFDASLFQRLRDLGDPDPTPIFVLGMPRSGTTLTEQILASHSAVHGAGELYDLSRLISAEGQRRRCGRQVPALHDWIGTLDAEALVRLGREYVARVRAQLPDALAEVARVTDKMPSNFRFVGLIHLMLPNARIVHTRRHPADTALSCYTKLFNEGQDFSYALSDLGRFYRGYDELMAHWRAVLPADAMLEVQYERLITDTEGQARRLLEFCGLPWEDACLRFHETKRQVQTASVSQVRRPVYTSSKQRWRRYEKHLAPFFHALATGHKETGPV